MRRRYTALRDTYERLRRYTEGGENVNKDDIKRILEEQLQLLSEHSKNGDPSYLGELTENMVKVVNLLREL